MKDHQLKELVRITGLTEYQILEVPSEFIDVFLDMRAASNRSANRLQNISKIINNLEVLSSAQLQSIKTSVHNIINSVIRDLNNEAAI